MTAFGQASPEAGMAGRRTSRAAALAKLVLPLLALAVLSTLFLFADRSGPPPLPYSEAEIDALAREMRLGAPRYAAVTGDGAALVVSAAEVRPGAAGGTARKVAARLRHPDGLAIDIAAPDGQLDTVAGKVVLSGGVTIVTGDGYRLDTERLTAALDRTRLESTSPVAASGPLGTLAAGGMVLTAEPGDTPRHVLVFNGGVRLVYKPAR
jgi:lipopolysaccharide export system protein LptC